MYCSPSARAISATGGLWEYLGGKLAPGEDYSAAAKRELAEELGLSVDSIGAIVFERQDPGSEFLTQFIEVHAVGQPQGLEHDAVTWVPQSELLEVRPRPH